MYSHFRDVETEPLAHMYHDDCRRVMSRKHFLYLFVSQGLGAAVVSGLINFAIACAMYRTVHDEIRVWPLNKHTVAGDLGVTIIIQSIVSTIIASVLVRTDVRARRQRSFDRPWPDVDWWRRREGAMKWIGLVFCSLSLKRDMTERKGVRHFFRTLFIIALQGLSISILYFFIFWPIAIALIAPLYGGRDLHDTWIPPVIKAVFGALLALFMNPFLAALALGAEVHETPTTASSTSRCISSTSSATRPPMIQTTTSSTLVQTPSPAYLSKEV